MQSIQCGGSSFLLRYFSILFCLISFWCLSFQVQLFAAPYLIGGQTLGLHTVGRGGIAPRKALPIHHDLTFSLAQHPSAFICTFLSLDYLMSSGVANDPLFLCGPFIAKYSFCNFFVRFLNLLLNKI